MSKYMLIFQGGYYDDLSPEHAQQQMEKWFGWVEKLRGQGTYLEGEPLVKGGKVLSQKNGKIVVVDGPFTESKEMVAGYFIVEAKSIDHAAEIAKEYPDFSLGGTVEVREVMLMDMPM